MDVEHPAGVAIDERSDSTRMKPARTTRSGRDASMA